MFSLLKIRKKTSAVLAGIAIGAACLWGIALWQDLTPRQLLNMLLGSILFILAIVVVAGVLGLLIHLLRRLLTRLSERQEQRPPPDRG